MKSALSLLCILTVSGCASLQTSSAPSDPRQTVQIFYSTLLTNKVSGLPDGKTMKALAPLMTPDLARYFREARQVQAVFMKHSPDEKPPWCEGDLFSSLFEGPQKVSVGEPRIIGSRAEVPVLCSHSDRSGTTRWTDVFLLQKTPRGWLVEDVRYGGKWPFAASGTLSEVLTSEGC